MNYPADRRMSAKADSLICREAVPEGHPVMSPGIHSRAALEVEGMASDPQPPVGLNGHTVLNSGHFATGPRRLTILS
jgi:hypothetical protein